MEVQSLGLDLEIRVKRFGVSFSLALSITHYLSLSLPLCHALSLSLSLSDMSQGQGQQGLVQQPETPPTPPHLLIPAVPQVFAVDDCVVMILKPQEYFRKKFLMIEGGGSALQVYSDFENVLTRTQVNGARTVGSGELLECAQNVLSPNAVAQLRATAADFALIDEEDMSDAHFEEFSTR
jgi:hypothetical protein